jgi:two-component system, NarL family, response regulator NreC
MINDNVKIKILLTDDHKIMRDGLKVLFHNHPRMTIIGEADNLESAIKIAQTLKPDIITMGMNIDGVNYFDIVRKLVKEFPEIKIVAHSVYIEKTFVSEMLKAGTYAYVHKEEAFAELVKAIDSAVRGDVYLCPRISNIFMKGYIHGLVCNNNMSEVTLTERERSVLKLLAEGKSSKEVALALHISTKTVDTHRRQIMNKINIFTVPELTKYAIRCGLTSIN